MVKKAKDEWVLPTALAILVLALVVMTYSTFALGQLTVTQTASQATQKASGIIPLGVPEVYGEELDISYDDVSVADQRLADATIQKMSQYEDSQLTAEQKQRYIDILYNMENGMSCEYCCGARSIIFENGERACGCAHSFAMRGLTKYLITEHGDMTDEQILSEVGKWKVLFFPTQMSAKAQVMEENGIEVNYITVASNQYRGIEKDAATAGQMVGGC